MRIRQFAAAMALGVAAVALSACAESISTTVSRYQAMPAPQGQTFYVIPDGGMARNGGLEFQRYAGLVAQQLAARGYRPAADAQSANMVVQFGYGVDRGQVRYVSEPYPGPISSFGWGSFYGSRWGFHRQRFGWGLGYSLGWDDPFWYGGGIDSYVEYHSQVDLHIRQTGTNAPLFDGRVQTRSST